jgi:hypothetical protein
LSSRIAIGGTNDPRLRTLLTRHGFDQTLVP